MIQRNKRLGAGLLAAVIALFALGSVPTVAADTPDVTVTSSEALDATINGATEDITISVGDGFVFTEQVTITNNRAVHVKIVGGENGAVLTKPAGTTYSGHFAVEGYADGFAISFENVVLDGKNESGGFSVAYPEASGNTMTVNNLTLTNCRSSYGGGIYLLGNALSSRPNVHFVNTSITSCTATQGGGAIYTLDSDSTFTGLTVTDCESLKYGGAIIFDSNSTAAVSDAVISGYTALAGGIMVGGMTDPHRPSRAVFTNTVIEGGQTTHAQVGAGSGFYLLIDGTEVSLLDSTIRNCESTLAGGAFYADDITSIDIQNSHITNNRAPVGGGICVDAGVSVNVKSSTITGNRALAGDGGGIYMGSLADLTVDADTVFNKNSAPAAYYIADEDKALHEQNIKAAKFSCGFAYGYNNYDINYTKGAPATDFFTVTFDVGEGAFADDDPSGTFVGGGFVPEPAEPTRTEYMFDGWYQDDQVWNFETDSVQGDMTLTAKWLPVTTVIDNQYRVTYDANGGTFVGDNPSGSFASGSLLQQPDKPVREGHTFGGWYLEGVLWSFESDTVQDDMILTARWIPLSSDGGQKGGATPETGSYSRPALSLLSLAGMAVVTYAVKRRTRSD